MEKITLAWYTAEDDQPEGLEIKPTDGKWLAYMTIAGELDVYALDRDGDIVDDERCHWHFPEDLPDTQIVDVSTESTLRCACGKFQGEHFIGLICDRCGSEVAIHLWGRQHLRRIPYRESRGSHDENG